MIHQARAGGVCVVCVVGGISLSLSAFTSEVPLSSCLFNIPLAYGGLSWKSILRSICSESVAKALGCWPLSWRNAPSGSHKGCLQGTLIEGEEALAGRGGRSVNTTPDSLRTPGCLPWRPPSLEPGACLLGKTNKETTLTFASGLSWGCGCRSSRLRNMCLLFCLSDNLILPIIVNHVSGHRKRMFL